jgi:hypothetical protein
VKPLGVLALGLLLTPGHALSAHAATTPATNAQGRATAKAAARPMVLPFLHDDYERAVAEARARKVPLFVEAWAPW